MFRNWPLSLKTRSLGFLAGPLAAESFHFMGLLNSFLKIKSHLLMHLHACVYVCACTPRTRVRARVGRKSGGRKKFAALGSLPTVGV